MDPRPHTLPHLVVLDAPFALGEIKGALRKMRTRKAPGADGIPTELLKASLSVEEDDDDPSHMLQALLSVTNFAFKHGVVADSWTESTVVSIPKKGRPCKHGQLSWNFPDGSRSENNLRDAE